MQQRTNIAEELYQEWSAYIKSIDPDIRDRYRPKDREVNEHQQFSRRGETEVEVGFAAIEWGKTHLKIWARLSYGAEYHKNDGWVVVQSDADAQELRWIKIDLRLAYERAYLSKKP